MSTHELSRPNLTVDEPALISSFPFRDLPEELQQHCINFCLPSEWHIRASAPMNINCSDIENPLIYGLRYVPYVDPSYFLVDKHMTASMQAASVKRFTGELYLSSVSDLGPGFKIYSQYGLGQKPNSTRLDSFRDLITIIHMGSYHWVRDFRCLHMSLLQVLPKLKTVIGHSSKTLDVESLYGWGDAKSVVNILPDDKLTDLVRDMRECEIGTHLRETAPALELLWDAGITTLVETAITVGRGKMAVQFYCIFWLRRDAETVVLDKHLSEAWESSSKLRRSVYEKAV